jgi:uncharacterized protein YndB with AHSA1/START domain
MTTGIRNIVVEVPVEAPLSHTWRVLLHELPDWWPNDFMCFPEAQKVSFEPWAGGRLYEKTDDGRELLWSTVTSIMPEKALEFVGYMTPTFGGPSISMIRIELSEKEGGGTLLKITDAVLGRVDDDQEQSLTDGWNYLFGTGFKQYAERKAVETGSGG